MSTVREAIDQLNEKHCHPAEHHLTMVRMGLLPEEHAFSQAPHNLMKQTFDWRYDFVKPEKDMYPVMLTKNDIKYIGDALEVYHGIIFELHEKKQLESVIQAIGEKL